MEFRKVFDTIPEQFDKYRPRYNEELFADLISYAEIKPGKTVLELGPGTGQATEPILNTGCSYNAIELGEHLADMMRSKYGNRANFNIVNADFITHNFGNQRFDMIYSAATIQWIPEDIAFRKTFDLLKPGGVLAMLLTKADYKTSNEKLYNKILKNVNIMVSESLQQRNMLPFAEHIVTILYFLNHIRVIFMTVLDVQ